MKNTRFRSTAVAATAVAISGSPGNIFSVNAVNLTSLAAFIKLYNAAAANVTVGTTVPVNTLQIPASSSVLVRGSDLPFNFDTAMSVAVVTGGADSSTTAPTTSPILEIEYQN